MTLTPHSSSLWGEGVGELSVNLVYEAGLTIRSAALPSGSGFGLFCCLNSSKPRIPSALVLTSLAPSSMVTGLRVLADGKKGNRLFLIYVSTVCKKTMMI
jgi:hypothetical protein